MLTEERSGKGFNTEIAEFARKQDAKEKNAVRENGVPESAAA
jgi:hypothetical protein